MNVRRQSGTESEYVCVEKLLVTKPSTIKAGRAADGFVHVRGPESHLTGEAYVKVGREQPPAAGCTTEEKDEQWELTREVKEPLIRWLGDGLKRGQNTRKQEHDGKMVIVRFKRGSGLFC